MARRQKWVNNLAEAFSNILTVMNVMNNWALTTGDDSNAPITFTFSRWHFFLKLRKESFNSVDVQSKNNL